jgi:hypothetical protein
MMCKIGSDYLDGFPDVEVERKIKLFENLDQSDGDVSFQFDVPETSKNARLLSYPVPDSTSKEVYHRIDCDLQDDSGVSIYVGFLRIERRVKRELISLSFFSGNSNWFGLISGNLSELDMSQYDVEQNEANIIASWANTSGLTFPLVDAGALLSRSFKNVKIEDLVGALYVHTVITKIFNSATIKLTGELFEEPLYQKLITLKNSKSQTEIDARSAYIHTSLVSRTFATQTPVTWDDDSTFPYYNGGNFNLVTGRYTADVKMNLKVEANLRSEDHPFQYVEEIYIYVNGVLRKLSRSPQGNAISTVTDLIPLNPGDYVTIDTWFGGIDPATFNIIDGTVKFTPNYIYKTFGDAALPSWTKQQYVSNIFQLFNVITSFDPKTKTLTCNLFEKLKEKEPIDISRYVTVEEVDYTSFVSYFGKKSKFSYNEIDFDEVGDYNLSNYFKYGVGAINVDNEFIPEEEDIINLEFSNPFSYINGIFDMSMDRMNLIELNEGDSQDFTSVTNAVTARFNVPEDIWGVDDLMRITDSTNPNYNGEYSISAVGTGWVELFGLSFDTDATGTLTKLDYSYSNDDDVFLLVNIPSYSVPKFSGNDFIYLGVTEQSVWGLAYFSLLNTARQINIDYKQSLTFGEIQDPLFYQRTILETYWSLVSRVLNDPVKPICTGVMPANVYRSIDFLRPLIIQTLDTSNIYYANLMSGYRSSYEPFRIELIKLA